MKKVNTLGALLLTTAALAFDSTSVSTRSPLPISFKPQPAVKSNLFELVKPVSQIQTTPKQDSKKMFGTFYASELFWSTESNELYISGNQVKVNLNNQKFTGSGKFSFLNKVGYLIVNGEIMKMNETIQLTDNKYSLVKLSQPESVKKYGDKASLGAVEITLTD